MKIIWIEKKLETENYYLTDAKFRNSWGKDFVKTCVTEKGMPYTKYFENGEYIPVKLWTPFLSFLQSDMDYIQPKNS